MSAAAVAISLVWACIGALLLPQICSQYSSWSEAEKKNRKSEIITLKPAPQGV